jgi:hypothetical protein
MEAQEVETNAEPSRPSAGGSTRLASAFEAIRAVGRRFQEWLLVGSLAALCVGVKLLWLLPVDVYWDAGAKWHFARQWFYSNDFSQAKWSHHMARMGVNVPTYVSQLLFGTAPSVYYVVPIASFTLQTVFVYLLGRRLGGRAAGVLGALVMILSPGMTRTASQLFPDGIAGTAAVIAGYAFVRFHEEVGAKRWRWLVGTGLASCWAYSIKESTILLFPGVVVAVWLSRRSYKEALGMVGLMGGYGLLETACFRLFTPYAHRLAVVRVDHGFYPPIAFWDLFDRFGKLDPSSKVLFWTWVVGTLYHLRSPDRRRRLLMILPLGFVFFLTFLVRRIDPIIPWQSFKPRYMSPAMSLMVVGASVFVTDVLQRGWAKLAGAKLSRVSSYVASAPGGWTFILCLAIGSLVYWPERDQLARHPLVELRRDANILNDAFARNLPIIERPLRRGNPRAMNTIYAMYLRPENLATSDLARGGRLPDIQEGVRFAKVGRRRIGLVVRDRSVYGRRELEKLIDAGCAVEVTANGRVRLRQRHRLPARCQASGELAPGAPAANR